jgi:hypothetical protein
VFVFSLAIVGADVLFQFGLDVGVTGIQEGNEPVNSGRRLLPESGEALERGLSLPLLSGEIGRKRISGP